MEPVIQKYLTALETKDFEALAELFTRISFIWKRSHFHVFPE